jgi:glycine hydroxymethyltransferase
MHVIAAKAVAFGEALQPEFGAYAQCILDNAQALAHGLTEEGLRLVSGGTDNHLVLVDLRPVGVTGKAAEEALDNAGLHSNKNMIPYDPEKPAITSGIRLGTPAVTTRGMGPGEMRQVAAWIGEIVRDVENEDLQLRIRDEVRRLCAGFPVPA